MPSYTSVTVENITVAMESSDVVMETTGSPASGS